MYGLARCESAAADIVSVPAKSSLMPANPMLAGFVRSNESGLSVVVLTAHIHEPSLWFVSRRSRFFRSSAAVAVCRVAALELPRAASNMAAARKPLATAEFCTLL
jgi:hypothetical protein